MENKIDKGQSWPEQEAIETWFRNHSMELKDEVSKYRIEIQRALQAERDRAEAYRRVAAMFAKKVVVKRDDVWNESKIIVDAEAKKIMEGKQ